MAVQLHPTSGNVLIADSGDVAIDPNCCCDSDPGHECTPCPDCGPETVTVVFSGLSECEACRDIVGSGSQKVTPNGTAPLNGIYVLGFVLVPINSCSWSIQINNSWVERNYSDDACVTQVSANNKNAVVRVRRATGTIWRVEFFLTNEVTGNPWWFFDGTYDMGGADCSGLEFNVSNSMTCGVAHSSGVLPWADGGSAAVTFGNCSG